MSKNQKDFDVTNTVFLYLILALPLIIALDVLYIAISLEQIPNFKSPLDKLFQAGLWFVIVSSIAAIYGAWTTDNKIKHLKSIQNKKIEDIERGLNEKINLLESRLTEIIDEYGTNIHDSGTKIDLLIKLELLKSELEKRK